MSIAENIATFEQQLVGTAARLVVVTKTHPVEKLREAYAAGARLFGENRVQEMAAKQPELPADVQWHQIGQLQTNKVKYLAPFVHTVESVDSLRLLQELDKQAARHNRVIRGPAAISHCPGGNLKPASHYPKRKKSCNQPRTRRCATCA